MAKWPWGAHEAPVTEDTDLQIQPLNLGQRRWHRRGLEGSCRSRMAAGLTCVVPARNACSCDMGSRGVLTPTLAQGRACWKPAAASACQGGWAGQLAECVVASHESAPLVYSELALSGTWHLLWHAAATQQVLCEGTMTHLSHPAAST